MNAPDPTEIPGEEGEEEPAAERAAAGRGGGPLLDYVLSP